MYGLSSIHSINAERVRLYKDAQAKLPPEEQRKNRVEAVSRSQARGRTAARKIGLA